MTREVLEASTWTSARLYPDPYGQLAGTLGRYLAERLGDDTFRWQLLARYSDGFTGTVTDLADIVCGVALPGAAPTVADTIPKLRTEA